MLKVVLVILAGFFIGEVVGYLIHRLLHWERVKFFNRRHMTHHQKLYPTHDFLSDKYRDPGKDNTMYIFSAFIALACLILFLTVPLWIAAIFSAEFILIGFANDYIHDAFHIRFHKLEKYELFLELRRLHYNHHVNMSKNYGIFSWIGDKLFGTFEDPAK